MALSDLSANAQDYLKVIWGLQEWSDTPVTPSTIARRAGVRPSTASGAIAKLAEHGLIEHAPYGEVTLTDQGRTYAIEMTRRHRLIETFLLQILGYSLEEVHAEAEHLEHSASDLMVQRIDALLGHPERDPHGDPIPRADGTVPTQVAQPLLAASPGTRVRVERISDGEAELVQFFSGHGIVVGALLRVDEGDPSPDTLGIRVLPEGTPITLGRQAAAQVWVSPADADQG
ncbi:MAG: metal-dependent transcriptional regulator [Pauljensenia sp.]